MRGGPHILIGMGVGVALTAWRPDEAFAVISLAALGGLLPDIDHHGSMIGRRAGVVSLLAQRLLRHRGAIHSVLAAHVVAVTTLLVTGNQAWAAALWLGYLSHLLADGFSRAGVPYFWPAPWMIRLVPRRYRVRSGTNSVEWPLALVVVGVATVTLR